MNKVDGPFNPKCKKLHLRAYLLGTISDAKIAKNDGNSQLVKIRQLPSKDSTSVCFIHFSRIKFQHPLKNSRKH